MFPLSWTNFGNSNSLTTVTSEVKFDMKELYDIRSCILVRDQRIGPHEQEQSAIQAPAGNEQLPH